MAPESALLLIMLAPTPVAVLLLRASMEKASAQPAATTSSIGTPT
jgi:hypothetical protein